MRGLSRKLYLDLSVPTEEDQRSDQQRILEALSAEGVKEEVHIPVRMLRQLYIFEYITGSLTKITFEIYAAGDIKAADGVSADYYKANELIGTITTDENGIAQMGDLPVGKYYVKEVETAHGYVLDSEPRYVDLSYRDQDTPVVTYDEDWQNNRQKVSVNVLKKE